MKKGTKLINVANPEWGTWTVLGKYDEGIWEIRREDGRADRTLFDDELHFWKIIK